ncbi:MAG: hypothetical protein QF570_08325 [Myxococcota bacterium]|nr:hypothetical protein [Myxococcota bacterium]
MLGTAALFAFWVATFPALAQETLEPGNDAPATASALEASEQDGPAYAVGQFTMGYLAPHDDHPSLARVLPRKVRLLRTPSGFVAPRSEGEGEAVSLHGLPQPVERYHASAIAVIARALLRDAQDEGLMGVFVLPHPEDINPNSEADLRDEGNFTLRFAVATGRIQEVRTIAVGDRITGDWLVNHKAHSRIRDESPLQPAVLAQDGTSDLLRRDVLEDYLHQLNRHPGRHVEAALASSQEGNGVALDYRVHEARPWTPYLQVADTGTRRTNLWQSRLGVIHRQLTGNDDVLVLEYLNAGFDNLNGINGAYEAPWFRNRRPRWMKTSGFEPSYLSWLDRDKVPWWGLDNLRWRLSGGYSRVEIDLGNVRDDEVTEAITEDWNFGGEGIYQVFQHENLFVDLFAGGRIRQVELDNESLGNKGTVDLSTGGFGGRFERSNAYSNMQGRLALEFGSADGSDRALSSQGRTDVDDDWIALQWNLGVSHYLEPMFNREAWEDPTTAESSTLAHEVALSFRGQHAFDYRLLPQVSQVIGGFYSVRGFSQGAAVGDSTYVGSVEYRFHLPRALPIQREPLQLPLVGDFRATPQQVYGRPDWDFVIRSFLDMGYSDRNGGKDVLEFDQFLMSAGLGLEATFKGNLRVRADWARGIAEHHSNSAGRDRIDKSGKFHFLFSVMY